MNAFRNLTLYSVPEETLRGITIASLDDAIARCPLSDPSPTELARHGFTPLENLGGGYTHEWAGKVLFCFGSNKRVLPTAAINAEVRTRMLEIQAAEGRNPGGKEYRRIRDEVFLSMCARAFVVPSRTQCVLDLSTGWLWIDTASPKTAELVISALREALGSFPALPARTDESTRATLTAWLTAEESPRDAAITIGTSCVLIDPCEGGARITARDQEMFCEEIEEHLRTGKQCEQLALSLAGRVQFTFDDKLIVRRIAFNDDALASIEDEEDHVQATTILMLDETAKLVQALALEFALEVAA